MRTLLCSLWLLLVACSVPATRFTPGSTADGPRTGDDAGDRGSGDAGTTGTPPMLSSSSTDVALGTYVIGQTSAEASVTISNDGDQASGPLQLSLDDTTTGFTILDDECSMTSLAGHTTCTFGVTFTPSAAGAVQSHLNLTAEPGGTVTVVVSGAGIVQGQVDITETSYAFGRQGLGATPGTTVFAVSNTGDTQIGTPQPEITGNASFEILSTTCNAALDAHGTCSVTVEFAPSSVGSQVGALVVMATSGGQDSASLSGTAFAHVAVMATGGGTVTSTPSGISCASTCAYDFISSPITLEAAPDSITTFSGWGGDCSGTGDCALVLDGAKSVTATFTALAPPQIDITEASHAFGSQGLGATDGTYTFTVRNVGQLQSGTPMPTIVGGDPSYKVQATTCTAPLAPNGSCSVTVELAPTTVGSKTDTLSVSAMPGGSDTAALSGTAFAHVTVTVSGGGTIMSSPGGISCTGAGTCAADFTSSPVTLAESPDAHQTFTGWSGGCTGTGGCSLTLNAPKSVTASFSTTLYPVTVAFTSGNTTGTNKITSTPAGIDCTGSTGCTGMFPYGSSVKLTASPDATWGRFVSWSSGPCAGSTNPVCTFTVPAASTMLAASFTWFATMTIEKNQGVAGNSPVTTQVTSSDGTLACTNTTTLAGTCVMHFGRNSSITFTYAGTPAGLGDTWSACPMMSRYSVSNLNASASGSCTPPDGVICTTGSCAAESCTMSFTTAGDYTSGYDVACETTAI